MNLKEDVWFCPECKREILAFVHITAIRCVCGAEMKVKEKKKEEKRRFRRAKSNSL